MTTLDPTKYVEPSDAKMTVFEAMEVTAAPVYDPQQLLADEHLRARGFFREVDDPDFGAVTSRLWSLLRTESMLAMGQGRAAAG